MHHCAPCSATTVHSTGAHFSSPQINGFTRFRNNSQFVCFSCGTPPSPEQVPPSKPEIKAMGKIISSGSSRTIGFPKMLKPFVGGGRGRVIHPPPPLPPLGGPPRTKRTQRTATITSLIHLNLLFEINTCVTSSSWCDCPGGASVAHYHACANQLYRRQIFWKCG